ncbi:hypothetical protein HC757_10380 [Shewanella sp. SHSM-M6]|uniref:Membrane anchored protein in chemotaxis locus n=2 Tax=Shewanella salipaludis TaxID=2723052 RepID=A0A972FYI8_9GAMM|nr:hypothetical protein [Shewanella salipaludis]NMH65578.1 hypothetical protein [Shewanella salipaludis]
MADRGIGTSTAGKSTAGGLAIFLLAGAVLVLLAFCTQLQRKNSLLLDELERLQAEQVVLMAPSEQAQALASWLDSHPQQTRALVQKPSQASSMQLGQDAGNDTRPATEQAVILSENAAGVKVVSLPDGGIRVTTRVE